MADSDCEKCKATLVVMCLYVCMYRISDALMFCVQVMGSPGKIVGQLEVSCAVHAQCVLDAFLL